MKASRVHFCQAHLSYAGIVSQQDLGCVEQLGGRHSRKREEKREKSLREALVRVQEDTPAQKTWVRFMPPWMLQ